MGGHGKLCASDDMEECGMEHSKLRKFQEDDDAASGTPSPTTSDACAWAPQGRLQAGTVPLEKTALVRVMRASVQRPTGGRNPPVVSSRRRLPVDRRNS